MMVGDYVRWDDGQFDDDYFPLILWGQMLDQKFYDELKGTWPNFNEYKTESFGQRFRDNLLITQQMRSPTSLFYREHYAWLQLEAYLASSVFISKLIAMFPKSIFDKHGFIGKLENLSLDFQLCEAFSGYENPWHVDTRKRIFHMLLYFGEDGIESGGEIGLARVKSRDDWQYPQFPSKDDIVRSKYYKPKDNFGMVVLSTPDSYHKGMPLLGRRKFLYIGINSQDQPCWKGDWSSDIRPFDYGLLREKTSIRQ